MKKKGWIATCILTVVAIFYVSPLFVVLMNSFKKKAFINLEPFNPPTEKTWIGLENYANAVNTLSSMGVVNGTGSNRFQPDSPISRQDASLMIQRTLKTAGISAENGSAEDIASYPDAASVASYAQGAVSGLARMGLIPTAGDGRLAPADPLTRADMAVLLHRAMTQ